MMQGDPPACVDGAARGMDGLFSLAGRRALVTGGSLSIGRAVVEAFAGAGARIAVHYSERVDRQLGRPTAIAECLAAARARGGEALAIEGDLERAGAGATAVADATAAMGGLDVMVVCASVQHRAAFEALDAREVERQVRMNFTASIDLMQAAVGPMRHQRHGRILAIGSINAVRPEPDLAIYGALKSAQHTLVVSLARSCAADGVTVNTISPGLIATERNRWRRADAHAWSEMERRANPMGRAGMPEDVAAMALLLAGDAGRFITGADIPIDGGGRL